MVQSLRLVSHHLCPYVQRAVIALTEKGVPYERTTIDLAAKPAWFLTLSATGKVPLLLVDERAVLFESAVICEYLEETTPKPLHPADPLERAEHRAWIEFASGTLSDIAGLYGAADKEAFGKKRDDLIARFDRIEGRLDQQPYFAGQSFSLVDAAFAPVFRYLDALERLAGLALIDAAPKVQAWRAALAERPSVKVAVAPDYPERLKQFLRARRSHLSTLIESRTPS